MHERHRRQIEQLRAEQALLREAAAAIRAAPATKRWAVLSDDPRTADLLASIFDFMADHHATTPGPDREHACRVAAGIVGRPMDRPTVRRTRRY